MTRCQCGGKKEGWQLLCKECWRRVPGEVTAEVLNAYAEMPGSPRHVAACKSAMLHARGEEGVKA